VNPVVAWKVCKTLSIAAGPTFDYANVEQTRGVFAPDDQFRLNGSGTGVGCNAGILWQPVPEHSFGVHYHSATDVELSGHTTVDTNAFAVSTPLGPVTIPAVHTRDPANARFHFPQFVTVGYSFRPTPDWNLEANVDWTDWDSLNSVIVHQSNSPSLEFPFDWKSSFAYEFGVTRYFEHGFHASAGYIYSEQTVPNATFTPGIPDGRRDIFSVGVGQRVGRINWDLSYQYTHQLDRSITNGTAVDGVYHLNANAISLALGYTF
jgi:long-chain fatty acid transport protein